MQLEHLSALDLRHNELGDDVAVRLLQSLTESRWPKMMRLKVGNNEFTLGNRDVERLKMFDVVDMSSDSSEIDDQD
ncbi:hypothetical protein MIR68_002427 [Amoeboaphelidium protococcarum]|nr:hypothetical protein MIR68_002427 [Amoeboaphelidium protococcarum]